MGDKYQPGAETAGTHIRSFEDLECWKACRELRTFVVRRIIHDLPAAEKHRLADQLFRAARSTTANIAEGYGRFHYADNNKFCSNARGSAWEVLDHLITANDEEMITEGQLKEGREHVAKAVRLLNGYMAYLKRASQR
ncbi:MAG: four helix bundle protein [Opitutaceae bacterium]